MRWLVALCLSLISIDVFAQKLLPSVEWQKTALKQQIENKVSDILMHVLKHDEFFVSARIDLTVPQMPNFNKTENNKENLENAESTKINKIKSSNESPEDDPYGYIVFQKMGLEVPLIDDFQVETQVSPGKNRESEANDFENVWKYNKAIDIYNNIDHILITIKATNKIKTENRAELETLIKEVNLDIPGIQPDIKFDYVNFNLKKIDTDETGAKAKVPPTFIENIINGLEKFQYPITIISAVCLLGLFGLMLLKRYQQILLEQGPAATTMTMENNGSDSDKEDESHDSSQSSEVPVALAQSEIDRFRTYLEQAPHECASLARSWIREGDNNQSLALTALVNQLPNDKLASLVVHFSEEDKGRMRSLILPSLKGPELVKANSYIGSQVRDEIIKGEKIEDPELQEMLLSLSPKSAAKMMMEHPASISVLFSKLTPKFLSLILEQLSEPTRSKIVNEAVLGKTNNIDLKAFKTALIRYAELDLFSPVLEKIKLIIPDATRNTENTLYGALAKHGNTQSIKLCAQRYLPHQLVIQMPEELLKESLLSYDSARRVEYLETLAEGDKDLVLNAFAPAGSKARDIYELDYERILTDESAKNQIEENSDSITKNFIVHLREYIKKNPQYQSKIEAIIAEWAEEMVSHNSQRPELKVVA